MITFIDTKGNQKEAEKCLDSQLWHACAGSMVQMPPVDSLVFYFPQGHAEHSREFVDFRKTSKLPPYIPCRVSAIKFMADPVTDEVYAKIKLNPVRGGDSDDDSCNGVNMEGEEKPSSFAKTLTQSDANNGGGFSVPRYCAETIFPRLDYSADPPVQTILARDVQGETWKFRHIYRGTPRRHLLTTGWSAFVNHKKLVAGDSIVFLRTQSGELCVGIRRAKRVGGGGSGGGSDPPPGWNPAVGGGSIPCGGFRPERPHGGGDGCLPPPYGSFSMFLREGEMRNGSCNGGERLSSRGKMGADLVIEAMNLAARREAFEVEYYPRASTPEFCIKASLVKAALQIRWCSGMRFKMPFETEDSSRISWFMGTISSIQVADPIRWPDSPWRLLQVTWDEPDLLQNVKHVSPWLVELVSTMPPLHLSPFSPPWKKPKHQHPEFPLQFPMPSFTGATHLMAPPNPHIPSFAGANHIMAPANGQIPSFAGATHMMAPENSQIPSFAGAAHQMAPANTPAGMQGARHARFGFPLPDFHFEKLHSALFATSFPQFDKPRKDIERENVSCLLTMGTSKSTQEPDKVENSKPTASQFVLFGQPILTEEQISSGNSSSESNTPKITACEELDTGSETGHCKVFMESDDVGRTLDLSVLGSYEELYHKLANMFGTESSEMTNHVISRDVTGSVKQIGDEPFGDFVKTAKRLTILMDSGSDNVGV